MTLPEQPWARVRNAPPLPQPLEASTLHTLDSEQLGQLLRAHLMPRSDAAPDRAQWSRLWRVMVDDDQLRERAFDTLEDLMDITEDALDAGTLDDAGTRRATKFLERCEEAWSRLQPTDALAWAGPVAEQFNPRARVVLAFLVSAIASHRAAVMGSGEPVRRRDRVLWSALRRVKLDPSSYDGRSRA